VASALFEMGCGGVILLSVLAIAWEIDAVLSPELLQFLESAVTAFFLVEWLVRLKANGWQWLLEVIVMFDTFLVWVPGVLAVWFLQPLVQDGATDFLKVVRTIRMLRLLRIVLFFKHFQTFQDLFKLVRGLLSSGSTLLSAMGLIAATLYTFAIFAIDLIGNQDFTGASADVLATQLQFQGIFTTMVTLMRFMHGDDCQGILDVLTPQQPWIWIFLWLFTSLSSYVLLNLVTAVIVQQALEMSSADEAQLALQLQQKREEDMRELEATFRALDEDQSGQVSLEEFMQAFKVKEVRTKMTLLGLKESEMFDLFRLLDTDGEGELSLEEFMQGMSQLKGEARNKDMLLLEKCIERLGVKLKTLEGKDLEEILTTGAFDKETGHNLRSTFRKIKKKINKRLTEAEREVQEVANLLSRLADECAALPAGLVVPPHLLKKQEAQTPEVQAPPQDAGIAPPQGRGSLFSEGGSQVQPNARGSLLSDSSDGGTHLATHQERGSLFSDVTFAGRPLDGGAPAAASNARRSLFSNESQDEGTEAGPNGPKAQESVARGSLFSVDTLSHPGGVSASAALAGDSVPDFLSDSESEDEPVAPPEGSSPTRTNRGSLFSDGPTW